MDGIRLQLLPRVIADVREVHDYLNRLSGLDKRKARVTETILSFAALGVRQLEAARLCIETGGGPESTAHARAAWECAIDAAFFLSHGADARQELGRLYTAMIILRPPAQIEVFDGPDREQIRATNPTIIEFYDRAKARYGQHRAAIKPRGHWSGCDARHVREAAYQFLEGLLDEEDKNLPRASCDGAFNVPSQFLHADPGVTMMLPLDRSNARVRIDPCSSAAVFEGAACVAGVLLFLGVSRRGSSLQKGRARPLVRELREFLGLPEAT